MSAGGFAETDAGIAAILSSVDLLRRAVAHGVSPLAEVYLEGARGNLHHAREALLYGADTLTADLRGVRVVRDTQGALCRLELPDGWADEAHPARPDLGADLLSSPDVARLSSGWLMGGMLVSALADHAWLHLATGTSWATDRSGALALVAALGGGRPVADLRYAELAGTLEVGLVRTLAGLGWRRLRSPRLEFSGEDAALA